MCAIESCFFAIENVPYFKKRHRSIGRNKNWENRVNY